MSLKFIALSGTTDVTENFYLYEYANDIIIVDCGVGFPETEMYGVDLVIPDFSYVIENKSKLRGVIFSLKKLIPKFMLRSSWQVLLRIS